MLISLALAAQQREISPAAWIALALILVFIFILNFSLWAALKRKNRSDYGVLHRLGDAVRNANRMENEMLNELRQRVGRLEEGSEAQGNPKGEEPIGSADTENGNQKR